MSSANPIRIVHIQKVAGIAGSENHLLTLLPRLHDAGFEPAMLVLADSDDRPDDFVVRLRGGGVPTEVLRFQADISPVLLFRLVQYLRTHTFDIVHTHLLHADLYGALAARLAGVRTIISTRHNPDPFRTGPFVRSLTRLSTQSLDHVICISDNLRQFCESIERVSPDQITTVHYGFAPWPLVDGRTWRKDLGLNDDVPVLGMVARMIPQKGHATLLEALPRVLQQFSSAQLVLIGDGPLRPSLEAQAKNLGIHPNVHFLGYRADSAALMPGFDVFVHPSRWEGFGLVFLEAMHASLPIVATTASAIPEIVRHGETGLLVPPDNPSELAKAICRVLVDRQFAMAMGRAGRCRLEGAFSIVDMVERTCAIYRQCLARKALSPQNDQHATV